MHQRRQANPSLSRSHARVEPPPLTTAAPPAHAPVRPDESVPSTTTPSLMAVLTSSVSPYRALSIKNSSHSSGVAVAILPQRCQITGNTCDNAKAKIIKVDLRYCFRALPGLPWCLHAPPRSRGHTICSTSSSCSGSATRAGTVHRHAPYFGLNPNADALPLQGKPVTACVWLTAIGLRTHALIVQVTGAWPHRVHAAEYGRYITP